MKVVKVALLITLVLVLVSSFLIAKGYVDLKTVANGQLVAQLQKIPQLNSFFDEKNLATVGQDAKKQTEILSSKAQEVGGHVSNVLGSTVEANEDQPSLQERAIDYGRYLYCQQVVKDYEKRIADQEKKKQEASVTPTEKVTPTVAVTNQD
ncbi:MAG: hypothetical protein ACOZAN_01635 [Patescibacteria group bacterium]